MTRVFGLAAFAWTAIAWPAAAQTADELWERAVSAEQDADPARARRHYAELVAADPSSRLAERARRRIDWIDERIDGPLQEVMRARANPSEPELLALESALVNAPPSLVAREGWALLARMHERNDDVDRAVRAYRRWMSLSTGDERRRAASGLAQLLERSGESGGADRVIEAEALDSVGADITSARAIATARVAAACVVVLHLFVIVALVGRPRWGWSTRTLAIGFGIALVLVWPAALAHAYDPATSERFVWLLATSVPLLVLAALAGRSTMTITRRRVLAASAFAAQLALGFSVYVS